MSNHLGFFFFLAFFFFFFSKVRVGAKEGGSHYWEMAVAITCGYGGYLLPLLAAHSSYEYATVLLISIDPVKQAVTAQLLFYMPNFVTISSLQLGWEQNEIFIKFEWLENH